MPRSGCSAFHGVNPNLKKNIEVYSELSSVYGIKELKKGTALILSNISMQEMVYQQT